MKKFYASFVVVFAVFGANAQLKSGQLIAGGNVNYQHQTIEYDDYDIKLTQFKFSPSAGIFVINKLATGVRVTMSGYRTRKFDTEPFDLRSRNFALSPFARYYILPANKNYNLFADASFDFHKEVDKTSSPKRRYYGEGFSVSAGPVIFITPQIAAELAFGYSNKSINSYRTTSVFTTLGFQFHFRKGSIL